MVAGPDRCLAIQAAQALVLTAAVRVFSSAGWLPLHGTSNGSVLPVLTALCLLYIMMRIPWWVSRPVLSAFGPSPIRRTVKFAFYAAVLSRVSPLLRGAAGARRPPSAAAAGAAGRPGHAEADPPGQADPRHRQAAGQEPAPGLAPGLAGDSQAPLPRAGASEGAPDLAAAAGRRRAAAPRRRPGTPARSWRAGGTIAGTWREPRPRPPAPGRAAARPPPGPQQRARPPALARRLPPPRPAPPPRPPARRPRRACPPAPSPDRPASAPGSPARQPPGTRPRAAVPAPRQAPAAARSARPGR